MAKQTKVVVRRKKPLIIASIKTDLDSLVKKEEVKQLAVDASP